MLWCTELRSSPKGFCRQIIQVWACTFIIRLGEMAQDIQFWQAHDYFCSNLLPEIERVVLKVSHIEKVIDDRPTCIIGLANVEDIQYCKWLWPSIDSAHPSHRASEVWCFYHVLLWSYSLSQVKFKHSYVGEILCITGCHPLLLL